jgi:hypothetical protein
MNASTLQLLNQPSNLSLPSLVSQSACLACLAVGFRFYRMTMSKFELIHKSFCE